MSKRYALPGAFVLPGLADKQRPSSVGRVSASRTEAERNSVEIVTPSTLVTSSSSKNDESSSLMDEKGNFLPQKHGSLTHLTKSRPKSPARRPANQTKRERSRSPDSSHDEFEYYAGLKHDSEITNIKSKQSPGSGRRSRSSTNNHLSQHRNEAKQTVVKNWNPAGVNNNQHVTDVFTLNDSIVVVNNMDSEISQDDCISDEDLGDMLIADYMDSDDSNTENKSPSINSSLSADSNSTQCTCNNDHSSKLFPSIRSNSEHSKNPPLETNTTNSKKLFPSLSSNNDSIIKIDTTATCTSQSTSKPESSNFPSNKHPVMGSSGLSNQSSARRRRFKPVSIEDVESNDAVAKDDNPSMNITFPASGFDRQLSDSNKTKKEVDWGLRMGPLKSSFSESTLKSGTMFDKFLKRNNKTDENQTEKAVDTQMKGEEIKVENNYFRNNDGDRQEIMKTDTSLLVEESKNIHNSIPDVQIDFVDNSDIKQKQSLSKLFTDDDDDDGSDIIESGSQYSDDDHYRTKDDDAHHDGDDENDDDDEVIEYYPQNIKIQDMARKGLLDNSHVSIDTISIDDGQENSFESDQEEHTTFNDSLGSVTDTHDMTLYSPGEIPSQYHHALNSSNELYAPPKWALDDSNVDESNDDEGDDHTFRVEDQIESMHSISDEQDHENYEIENRDEQLSTNEEMFPDEDYIRPPGLFDEDDTEDLFEPPPMFASDDELEEDEEADLFHDIPPPPLPMSPVQNKKVMPFHKIPLGDWTEEDTLEWLKYVGLGHFKEQFKAHHVNGRTLKNINFQLLEEIGISAPDERELVLAEIYELDNPSEEEHLEAEIQDALETASEQDKEKILAVLTALRSPTLNKSMEFPAVNDLDSDQGCHLSSDTASMTSSVTASDEYSHKGSTGVTPSHSQHSDLHLSDKSPHAQKPGKTTNEKPSKKLTKDKENKKAKDKIKKKEKGNKKQKKSFSKFWESLSIGHTSSKLTKVFGSKKFNPAMQYLLQAGPQGILRVWPTSVSGQTKYCSFMVSMTTTSAQVVRMVLEKYDVVADPLRYYLCQVGHGKGGVDQDLGDSDCPLTWQCRWNDPEKFRFEMRCRDEGSVRMLFEMEGYEGDLDYRSIAVSSKTPCKDVLPLIVKKYDLPGQVEEYQLMEVSEDNEDVRRVVVDHVCPLQLQKAWSEPDHVFRLVRKRVAPPVVNIQPQRAQATLSAECTELISELPRTNSNADSLRDGYDTDSTDHPDNTSEEADLPAISKELDEVVMEVQDSISSQTVPHVNTERTKAYSFEVEKHLEELKKKEEELLAKEKEIEELKMERENLLEKENELLVWRMRNSELVEREEELEKLQTTLLEKENHEQVQKDKELETLRNRCIDLSAKNNEAKELADQFEKSLIEMETSIHSKDDELRERDREIERLYLRNSELNSKEKEVGELQNRMESFTELQREFESLKQSSQTYSIADKQLQTQVIQLKNKNESLETELREMKNAMEQNTNSNTDQFDEIKLEHQILENENRQLKRKSDDLQRRNQLLEKSAKLLDGLRQENQSLLAKTKETEDMKRNIIRLTSQLREDDNLRINQGELDDLKLRLSICEAEKQQIQSRLDDADRRNVSLREEVADIEKLRKQNRVLQGKVSELEDARRNVETLRSEVKEIGAFQQKLLQAQEAEKRLTKELSLKEGIIKQKDGKIDEMDKKIKAMTEAIKKMEAKFRDQEEQRKNLSRLLTIIKDKDPTLLRTLHQSIITSKDEEDEEEDEEWC